MLHGLGVSSASLGPLAERLAVTRRVVAPDFPGFGRTPAEDIWDTARIVEAMAAFARLRGLEGCVLAGHSYGCAVAVELTLRHPGIAAALVLLSPSFDRRSRSGLAQFLRIVADAPMERPSLVGGGIRDYWRAGPRRVLSTLREGSAIPLESVVAGVTAPVMVVRGSRDPLTTARWARELGSRAPRAAVATIPRAAHGLGHDAPRATAAAIDAFIAHEVHPSRMSAKAP
jgi:pimeloyl-ACP methyl ester carboxylesterase